MQYRVSIATIHNQEQQDRKQYNDACEKETFSRWKMLVMVFQFFHN